MFHNAWYTRIVRLPKTNKAKQSNKVTRLRKKTTWQVVEDPSVRTVWSVLTTCMKVTREKTRSEFWMLQRKMIFRLQFSSRLGGANIRVWFQKSRISNLFALCCYTVLGWRMIFQKWNIFLSSASPTRIQQNDMEIKRLNSTAKDECNQRKKLSQIKVPCC
jgi:hypothetical protein